MAESDCSRSQSDPDGFETGTPPGDLCNLLVIKKKLLQLLAVFSKANMLSAIIRQPTAFFLFTRRLLSYFYFHVNEPLIMSLKLPHSTVLSVSPQESCVVGLTDAVKVAH